MIVFVWFHAAEQLQLDTKHLTRSTQSATIGRSIWQYTLVLQATIPVSITMTKQVWPFLPQPSLQLELWQTTLDIVELYHNKFKLKRIRLCVCDCDAVTEFTLMRMLVIPFSFREGFFYSCYKTFSLNTFILFCFPAVWLNLACVFFVFFILQTYPFFFYFSLKLSHFKISPFLCM